MGNHRRSLRSKAWGSGDLIIQNRGASTALNVVVDGGEYQASGEDDHIVPHLARWAIWRYW